MRKNNLFILILGIFLLSRLIILLTCIDSIIFYEERHQGAIVKEIMEGPKLSLLEYPLCPYEGGSVLAAIVTVPLFSLFGQNMFALKLTPLLFSALTLAILFLFAQKYFNRRVAVITGLLFLFPIPIWISNTLCNLGSHGENILFTIIAVFLLYEIIFSHKNHSFYYFCLGFICGLGTYWTYTFLVTLITIFLIWCLHDKKIFFRKGFFVFWLGFLLWMIPWFYYNLASGFNGIEFIFSRFYKQNYYSLDTWLETIARFSRNLWFSGMFKLENINHYVHNLLGHIYLLIYWLSFLFIFKSYKYSLKKIILAKESFVFIFPALLIIIATLYKVDSKNSAEFINWRYFVGLFPIVFLTIAIAMDRIFLKSRVLKYGSLAFFSVFFITAIVNYSRCVSPRDFGSGFKKPGYAYKFLSYSFVLKYPHNFYKILDNITRVGVPQMYEVLTQIPMLELSDIRYPVDIREYIKLSLRLEDRYRPFFYKLLIRGLYFTSKLNLKELVGQVDNLAVYVDGVYRPYLYEGVGALLVERYPKDTTIHKEAAFYITQKYRPYYYRGLSDQFIYLDAKSNSEYGLWYKINLGWLPEGYKPLYLEGMGEALSKKGICDIVDRLFPDEDYAAPVYNFIDSLNPEDKIYVLEGIGKNFSYFIRPDNEREINQFINNLKTEADRRYVRKTLLNNLNSQ